MGFTMMSLFSGSGGFELASSMCGIEPVYASEVEPYQVAVSEDQRSVDIKQQSFQDSAKVILDVTCGDRSMWFQKNQKNTIYCDKRKEEWEGVFGKKQKRRHLIINPDIQCDFTNLPFDDESFALVIFDPPHIKNLSEKSWMRKAYGNLDSNWEQLIREGFEECMRVLKQEGVLIFKWSDISISTREVIRAIGQEPLIGHRSGKKMNTHWLCFMKF